MNWRLHAIAFGIFLFVFGSLKLVWDNPKIILYIILMVIGFIAYGAIYVIVKTKLGNRKNF